MITVGSKVRIASFPLGSKGIDWSTTGKIVRHHKSWKGKQVPAGYHTVEYSDGGRLMVHEESLKLDEPRYQIVTFKRRRSGFLACIVDNQHPAGVRGEIVYWCVSPEDAETRLKNIGATYEFIEEKNG